MSHFTGWHGALWPKARQRQYYNSVFSSESEIAIGQNHLAARHSDPNVRIIVLMPSNQRLQRIQVRGPLFDESIPAFALEETITSVRGMNDEIAFQFKAITVVIQLPIVLGGVDA